MVVCPFVCLLTLTYPDHIVVSFLKIPGSLLPVGREASIYFSGI